MKNSALFLLGSTLAMAAPLTLTLPSPPADDSADFAMGAARNPAGSSVTVDSRSLILDGQRWTPAMGEFHFSRYPADEWREELLKMKAGGIDIVATYVFWIHHEEIEGEWDWSGSRDLRRFIETAGSIGLKAIVRCGPWCHGEVRNGGLPDWVVARGNVRSDDPAYLASATKLYRQIAAQLRGLLWKDGGPVIGIQLENEYGGPASHLLTLKGIARECGLDVPLYTRTGWPALKTPMPFGEILPLYGVYAEGFWDRELTSMPGNYWAGFHFSTLRTDANIANEALGRRDVQDDPDVARYPYLTCEIGGGMMSSYHRRILVDPRDIESTTLVKLGSGSVSPGYYMYHGGTNPEGKLTTLMEEQATAITNWNDMPVKNYDFQAPLGQYGQVRPHYHSLRRLHYFLRECGSDLASMPVALPDARPAGRDDIDTLRWSVRSDGRRGFVFVNNHERGRDLPPKSGVQFAILLDPPTAGKPARQTMTQLRHGLATALDGPASAASALTFPSQPFTVPTDAAFIWPFQLDLGGVTLAYATAQPVTHVAVDEVRTVFFAETPGVPAEFAFDAHEVEVDATHGKLARDGDRLVVSDISSGRDVAIVLRPQAGSATNREIRIVLLSESDSLALWKGPWQGRNRIFLSPDPLVFDGDRVRVAVAERAGVSNPVAERMSVSNSVAERVSVSPVSSNAADRIEPTTRLSVLVYPAPASDGPPESNAKASRLPPRPSSVAERVSVSDPVAERVSVSNPVAERVSVSSESAGIFTRCVLPGARPSTAPLTFELTRAAGPLRSIQLGKSPQPVAAAPTTAGFADAAVWRIELPHDLDLAADPLLRLHYVGDVARVFIGDTFITDDYYNGAPLEIGLRRHTALLRSGNDLAVAILPLQKNAPIFLPDSAKPEFGEHDAVAELRRVELVTRPGAEL